MAGEAWQQLCRRGSFNGLVSRVAIDRFTRSKMIINLEKFEASILDKNKSEHSRKPVTAISK